MSLETHLVILLHVVLEHCFGPLIPFFHRFCKQICISTTHQISKEFSAKVYLAASYTDTGELHSSTYRDSHHTEATDLVYRASLLHPPPDSGSSREQETMMRQVRPGERCALISSLVIAVDIYLSGSSAKEKLPARGVPLAEVSDVQPLNDAHWTFDHLSLSGSLLCRTGVLLSLSCTCFQQNFPL